MQRRQAITTPYANVQSRAKPQKIPRGNLIQLNSTPDKRRQAKSQRVNVNRNKTPNRRSPLPLPTVKNKNRTINWNKSTGKNLT